MENSYNQKKNENFSTIFSKLDDTQKSELFSDLEFNLSKLRQSVSLLKLYGTKGKINSKKIRKKFFSSPKTILTEPNKQIITSRNNKTKDFKFILENKENNDNTINIKQSTQNPVNEMVKTSMSKVTSKSNIFMTNININYKDKKLKNILNSTNYHTNEEINKNSKKKLPNLNKININLSPEKIPLKTKTEIKIKSNTSRNRLLNSNKTINKEEFPKITNSKIKAMKKENNNIKKNIYKGIEKFGIMEWYMKTRFKYAEYKYGIAEIQKYFMDLKAYGKPEEEEIEKRKTFYEHVEDIVNDIHEIQQQKEMEKLNKKYGIEQDKKKIVKSKNEIDEEDPQKKGRIEQCKALQEISKRQKKERQRRQQIDDILFKCKQRIHSINSFDRKLPKNRRIYTNFEL